jgi:hypothetical protein
VNGTRSAFREVRGFGVSDDEQVVLQLTKLSPENESTCRPLPSCLSLAVGRGESFLSQDVNKQHTMTRYGEAEVYEYVCMYVCMNKGWARNPALAPRPSVIYCASPFN